MHKIKHSTYKPGDDTKGVRNFLRQEKEDFMESKGVGNKIKSLKQSVVDAKNHLKR